ncbi:hypothetical protein BASA81_003015 [Batrachochytrium salamandrivorans]|nr:hypothetical protein BASA81_003015 [Batrachochytrium salamandrivorans]
MSLHSNEEEEDYGNEEEEDYGSEEEEELVAHTENQRNGRGRTPDRTVNLPSSASDDDDDEEEEEEEELVPTHAKNQRNRRGRTPDRVVSTPGSASNKPTTTYQAPKPLAVDLHPALKAPGGASWWLLMVFVGFALGEQVFGSWQELQEAWNQHPGSAVVAFPEVAFPHEAMQVCEFMTYLAAILIVSVDYPVGKGVAVVGAGLWLASLTQPAQLGLEQLVALLAYLAAALALDKLVEQQSFLALGNLVATAAALAALYLDPAWKLASAVLLAASSIVF